MSKVEYFLLGAPKCGTTSLYDSLRNSKIINHSNRKEIFFFDILFHKKSLDWYETQFPESRLPNLDATPTYMFDVKAVDRVLNYNPDAKFIILIRDPLKRMNSHYRDLLNWKRNLKINNCDEDIEIKRFGIALKFNLYKNSQYLKSILYLRSRTKNLIIIDQSNLNTDDAQNALKKFFDSPLAMLNMASSNRSYVARSTFFNNLLGAEILRELSSYSPVFIQNVGRRAYHALRTLNHSSKNQNSVVVDNMLTDLQRGALISEYKECLKMERETWL